MSDSEDSFHSAEEDAEEEYSSIPASTRLMSAAVLEPEHVSVSRDSVTTSKEHPGKPAQDVVPEKSPARPLGGETADVVSRSLEQDEPAELQSHITADRGDSAAQPVIVADRDQRKERELDESEPSGTGSEKRIRPPFELEASMVDTDFVEENPWDEEYRKLSISVPDSPSVQSDKDSGNEMKDWDKLSTNGAESSSYIDKNQVSQIIDQVLLDEWEKGWEDEVSEPSATDSKPVTLSKPSTSPQSSGLMAASPSAPVAQNRTSESSQTVSASKSAENVGAGSLLGKWSGWGTSLFSTATASVTSLTSQVGHGITAVFETVEQGLGAPRPEELAARDSSEEKISDTAPPSVPQSSSAETDAGSDWLSGVTSKVQKGGLNIVSTGLGVLEGIGKKTMDVIQDRDPGLHQTKALLKGKVNQPVLSQVLREAKVSTTQSTGIKSSKSAEELTSFVHFFEEEQGTDSWEALEMLSEQCAQRLEAKMKGRLDDSIRKLLHEIDELCEPEETEDSPKNDDFAETVRQQFQSLGLGIPGPHKLTHMYSTAGRFLSENTRPPEKDKDLWCRNVHRNAVRTLAACTARSLEQIRKVAEMIYLNSSNGTQSESLLLQRVLTVKEIVNSLCQEMDRLANQFAGCLALGKGEAGAQDSSVQKYITSQITDIFVESSNSNRYLQDSLSVLAPIFKLALLDGAIGHAQKFG